MKKLETSGTICCCGGGWKELCVLNVAVQVIVEGAAPSVVCRVGANLLYNISGSGRLKCSEAM